MIVSVAAAPRARQTFPDRGCPDELLSSEEEGAMREDGRVFFGSFFGSVAWRGVALVGAWLAAAAVLLLAADVRAACFQAAVPFGVGLFPFSVAAADLGDEHE